MDRDASIGPDGLTRRDRDLIRDVLARYPEVRRVSLFGSRAMGTFGRGSDIDLALEGPDLDSPTLTRIATELEDSDLPYKVDLLLRDEHLEPKLEAHIRRYGKPIGWKQTTLGTLGDASRNAIVGGPFGSNLVSNDYADQGVPVIRGQNMGFGRWVSGEFVFVSDAKADSLRANLARPGDVVFTQRGTLGQVAIVPSGPWVRYVVSQSQMKATIDPQKADPRYVYYVFSNPAEKEYIAANAIQTGVPHTNLTQLRLHPISLPPLDEQRTIASVLGALDDKIEQNRRTALALERLARAIFRAWFVDFEPVKAKAAGAAAFPSMPQEVFDALPTRFIDSDLGPVPAGWEVKALDECVHLTMGQSPPSEYYNEHGEGLPFHQGVTDYGFRFPTHRVYCTTDGRLAEPRDVLVSVRAPVGRINVADRRLVLGRGLAGLRHRHDRQSFLLHQLCHVFAEEDAIGDGTIYKAVTKKFLSQMPTLSPPDEVEGAFDDLARPLDDLVAASESESRKLAEMRDYLLPRLLGGSVRVEVADG